MTIPWRSLSTFHVPVVAGVWWCQANPLFPCFSVSLLLNGYWPHSIMCLLAWSISPLYQKQLTNCSLSHSFGTTSSLEIFILHLDCLPWGLVVNYRVEQWRWVSVGVSFLIYVGSTQVCSRLDWRSTPQLLSHWNQQIDGQPLQSQLHHPWTRALRHWLEHQLKNAS